MPGQFDRERMINSQKTIKEKTLVIWGYSKSQQSGLWACFWKQNFIGICLRIVYDCFVIIAESSSYNRDHIVSAKPKVFTI